MCVYVDCMCTQLLCFGIFCKESFYYMYTILDCVLVIKEVTVVLGLQPRREKLKTMIKLKVESVFRQVLS